MRYFFQTCSLHHRHPRLTKKPDKRLSLEHKADEKILTDIVPESESTAHIVARLTTGQYEKLKMQCALQDDLYNT